MTSPEPKPTVLLVEDDDLLRTEMSLYLYEQGFDVLEAADATTARAHLAKGQVSVVVLDVNLPGENGLSLCRSLTGSETAPPILMLSAMGEAVDRILGLEIGADDYIVKPIPPRELLARIRALIRRAPPAGSGGRTERAYWFEGFRLDPVGRQLLSPGGLTLLLTRAEVQILRELLDHPRAVASRDDLGKIIGVEESDSLTRAVDLHISRLRRKVHAQSPRELIITHRGLGYSIDADVEAV